MCSSDLKKDALTSVGGSTSSAMPLFQMLLALGIVFALLKFALPRVANKLNKRLVTGLNSTIRIEESANFAGGSLYIVNAREKTLLLSVGTNGVSCVADLTPATKPKEAPLFSEVLDRASGDLGMIEVEVALPPTSSATAGATQTPRPEPDERQVRQALDRLARIAN